MTRPEGSRDGDIEVEVNLSEVERAARENGATGNGPPGISSWIELADGTVIEALMECPMHRHLGPWCKTHGDGKHVLQDYRCGCRLVMGGALPG